MIANERIVTIFGGSKCCEDDPSIVKRIASANFWPKPASLFVLVDTPA
jgi:hypothetical protein